MENINFIQTLYIPNSKNPYKDAFGWVAPEYHLMSWALSSLQLQRIYGKADLYCNDAAANLLINELELPYNKVHLSHNTFTLPDERLWALPKVYTYSLQSQPFLHVDGDVFLFEKLPSNLLQGNLIAQNIEEATDYYLRTQNELVNNFSYFPECVRADFKSKIPIKAVNAGILGGSDINFINEYTGLAFKYINKNIAELNSINVDRFNVFFEQHLFYSLAKEKQIKIQVLINSTIKDNQYLYLGNFHETPCKRSYLHLLGDYKKDELTCKQMAAKLRELHPEFYYKIILLFTNKTKRNFFSISTKEKFSSRGSYHTFSEKSVMAFHTNAKNADANIFEGKHRTSKTIRLLQAVINNTEPADFFTKKQLKSDFIDFKKNLQLVLNNSKRPSNEYMYGRDLDSTNWYCKIFANEIEIMDKFISKCIEVSIISSQFDWAGLYNKHTRNTVRFYEDLELAHGEFHNLIIPEIFGDGFSMEDIDEMENIILSHLELPMKVSELFSFMLQYVEEDIIQNHLAEYKALFFEMLKQLILKKAIMPARKTTTAIV